MAGKPGHGGKKGRSGRKRSPARLLKDAEDRISEAFPDILEAYIEKGIHGNEAILIDLVNRKLGKPKNVTDVNISGEFPVDILLRGFRDAIDKTKAVEVLELGKGDSVPSDD